MSSYERLRDEKPPKKLRDWTATWEKLEPIGAVNGSAREALDRFCSRKRISFEALEVLGARYASRRGRVCLAFAGRNRGGAVTAIKYRPVDGESKDSFAEQPSVWLEPIVCGASRSLDWVVCEGESDAARVYELVGDVAAVLVLPSGAATFKPPWAELIPRGATCYLAHDADEPGDEGAAKAARIIGGRTVRLRPPDESGDWCAWLGSREEFVKLVHAARQAGEHELEVLTARATCAIPDPPGSEELLGPLILRGQRLVLGGHTGEGKTTLALQIVRAVSTEGELLEWTGAGGRVLILDAEQGLRTVKRRLREAGLADTEAVDYVRVPDGLALDSDPTHIAAVESALSEGGYQLVVADPLYKLHAGDSNDEREAVDLMRRFDGWRERFGFALLLPVHCRKPQPGAKFSIHDLFGSSAYVRGAEVVLGLQRLSDGYSKLHFLKDRDGDLPIGTSWGLLFDREQGFRRDPNDGKVRDIRGELLELLADRKWWTLSELRRKKENGGIGAAPATIQPVLDALTAEGVLVHEVGPAGRKSESKCWKVSPTPYDTRDTFGNIDPYGEVEVEGVTTESPYRDSIEVTPDSFPATGGGEGVTSPGDTPDDTSRRTPEQDAAITAWFAEHGEFTLNGEA